MQKKNDNNIIPKNWVEVELGDSFELYQPKTISIDKLLNDGQ